MMGSILVAAHAGQGHRKTGKTSKIPEKISQTIRKLAAQKITSTTGITIPLA
jgi:hypothetical protein